MSLIRYETNDPKKEEEPIKIIENKIKTEKREFSQFKLAIPKKFSDFLKLNNLDFKATASLHKEENKIIITIQKNV